MPTRSVENSHDFRDYTDLIEPLSLDEAYLDVSDSAFGGSATRIAQDIRRRVSNQLHITVSQAWRRTSFWPRSPATGKSPTLVCDHAGSGRRLCQRLAGEQVARGRQGHCGQAWPNSEYDCLQLREWEKLALVREFGSFGERLWSLARGIDERLVHNDSRRQSISVENTYDVDLPDLRSCLDKLPNCWKP
jgi:DNA polymerase-4